MFDTVIMRIAHASEVVPVFEAQRSWYGDPADDAVIESALAGGAGYLVTGDKLLLSGSVDGLVILTPAEFAGFAIT